MLASLLTLFALADSVPPVPETARVVVVSARVGPEINALERRQYHLFPGIRQFRSARFRLLGDGSYQAEVANVDGSSATFPVTSSQFRRIGYYIDHCEALIPELAALPDGRDRYLELWQGIVPELTARPAANPPGESDMTRTIMEGLSGAALGLGVGGSIGALAGIHFKQSRPESIERMIPTSCDEPPYTYWEHFLVDVYELDRQTYSMNAGAGTAAGAGIGALVTQAWSPPHVARPAHGLEIVDYDLFGDPIYTVEVNRLTSGHNVVPATVLGAAAGWVCGAGIGLVATSIVRSIVFSRSTTDTIELRNDGFAFDVPLISIAVAGVIQGGYLGYRQGRKMDWRDALAAIKQTRITFGSSQER